jgi:hypothetical protein
MYKEILRSIVGIEIFPIISLCLFVSVFTVVLVWAARLDRGWLARQAELPLDARPPHATDRSHVSGGQP